VLGGSQRWLTRVNLAGVKNRGSRGDDADPSVTAWLLCGDRVLASLELATTRADRRRGLLGRDTIDGAIMLERTRWVHTVGMRFAIDVAFLDKEGAVIKLITMTPRRIGVPMLSARRIIEARAGAFALWGLQLGDQLETRGLE
jgi:uncharacterized protein